MARKTGKSNRGSGQDDYRAKMRKDAKDRKTRSFTVLSVSDDTPFFKPKKGWQTLDVIPYRVSVDNHLQAEKGDLWPRKIFGVHRNVGPEDKTYACPKETEGTPCPICEEYLKQKSKGDSDSEITKSLKPKRRELYNVVDLDSKEDNETIKLYEGSYYNFGTLLDEEINDSEEGGMEETYGMLEGGATIAVKYREETFAGRAYMEAAKMEFEKRDDYGEEWANDAFDLDKAITVPSYDALYEAFWDTPKDSDNDDNDRESRRSRSRNQDKEEETGDDDKEPSRRSRGRGRGKDEDANEDNEPESEPECPHGGEYGVDADELAECEDCEFWTACGAAKEGTRKSEKDVEPKGKRGSKKKGKEKEDKGSGRRRRRN